MDARPIDLTKLFEPTTQYEVPLFQRPFVWTEEKQWEPLWQDIRTAAERLTDASVLNDDQPHFMGAIVLELREAKELTYKSVIDGQQRLTSLQLMIAAARATATENGEPNLARKLETLLFFEDFLVEDPNHQFKLVPTNGDRVAFRLATRFDVVDLARIPPGDSGRTMEAYAFFRRSITDWLTEVDEASPNDKLDALVSVLRRNLRIVVIDIGKEENAQAIFETMNARGTPLLAADLVKNYLFQRAGQSRAEFLYGKYWADFDTNTWRREVGVGRAKRPRIDLLLGNWLMLRGEEDLHWQELFLDFRAYLKTIETSSEDVLADLRQVASVFDLLERYPLTSREGLFMYRLDILEAGTIRPLAIRMFGEQGIEDPSDRIRALGAVESWLVRRMLCRLTTKNYNRVVRSLLDSLGKASFTSADVVGFLSSLSGESQVWPGDAMVLESLRSQPYYTAVTRARLRMVLEAIEAELRGTMNLPFSDWNRLTVEHVLPQEWRPHWPLPSNVPELEATITRDASKHRLGNLTLVTQPLNSRLSNAPWASEELNKRDALRVHNVYMLNKPLIERAEWDERAIAERGEHLAVAVLRIWPGPGDAASAAREFDAGAPTPPEPIEEHKWTRDAAGRRKRIWDEYEALRALQGVDPALGSLGEAVMAWADGIPDSTYVRATRVPELKPSVLVHGEPISLFTLSNEGRVYPAVWDWQRTRAFENGEDRRRVIRDVNAVVGTEMRPANRWPSFEASVIYDDQRRAAFFGVMDGLARALRASQPPGAESDVADGESQAVKSPSDLNQRYQHFLRDVLERYMAIDPISTPPVVTPKNWLNFGAGRSGFSFVWSIADATRVRIELYIDVGDQAENKRMFDHLKSNAEDLEVRIGRPLVWERLDSRKASRISVARSVGSVAFEHDPELADWAAETMARFAAVLRPLIPDL